MSRRDILIVENNSDDLFFLKRALRNAHVTDNLHSVSEGRTAIAYLSGKNEYADRARYPLPWLIFLDLKLPYKTGIEVLEFIRGQPELQHMNVVVVTSSEDDKDMRRTTELGVNAYLMKPPSAYVLERLFASPQLTPPREPARLAYASGLGDSDGGEPALAMATATAAHAPAPLRALTRKSARNPWRYLYEAPSKETLLLIIAAVIGAAAVIFLIIAATQ